MSRWIEVESLIDRSISVLCGGGNEEMAVLVEDIEATPSIDIVRCKECKHRPIKEDPNGENYGFNLIEPNDGDERCPCLVSDGWYSWMPEDDFYCGFGEREGE